MKKHCPVCLAAAALVSSTDVGEEKAGVALLTSVEIGAERVHLNGMALNQRLFFSDYVAGLYLSEKSSNATEIIQKDMPRMMVLHYLRNMKAKKIITAWFQGLKGNLNEITPEFKSQFDQFAALIPNMKKNEILQVIYIPNCGTQIAVAGQIMGTLEGKDFADALLSTWIGPHPGPGEKFKRTLLGQ